MIRHNLNSALQISTLKNIELDELAGCFNESFSDYLVPMHVNSESLLEMIKQKRVHLNRSAGAFENGKLIGFVLIGIDEMNNKLCSYNAGTGVIPGKRGNQITRALYDFLVPMLNENIHLNILEVISENKKAVHIYESLGYRTSREFWCFKGTVRSSKKNSSCQVKELATYEWDMLRSFWDWNPSWQYDTNASERLLPENISIGAFIENRLIGYLIYHPASKKIFQFAVSKNYRNTGVASHLFNYIAEAYSAKMTIINIDSGSEETIGFLESIGLACFIKQLEMKLVMAENDTIQFISTS